MFMIQLLHYYYLMCVCTCLTSGAIQNGVPTDVFLRSRALVSWAETPERKENDIHSLIIIKM